MFYSVDVPENRRVAAHAETVIQDLGRLNTVFIKESVQVDGKVPTVRLWAPRATHTFHKTALAHLSKATRAVELRQRYDALLDLPVYQTGRLKNGTRVYMRMTRPRLAHEGFTFAGGRVVKFETRYRQPKITTALKEQIAEICKTDDASVDDLPPPIAIDMKHYSKTLRPHVFVHMGDEWTGQRATQEQMAGKPAVVIIPATKFKKDMRGSLEDAGRRGFFKSVFNRHRVHGLIRRCLGEGSEHEAMFVDTNNSVKAFDAGRTTRGAPDNNRIVVEMLECLEDYLVRDGTDIDSDSSMVADSVPHTPSPGGAANGASAASGVGAGSGSGSGSSSGSGSGSGSGLGSGSGPAAGAGAGAGAGST